MGLNFLGQIPFDVNMVDCGDNGLSFREKYPDSPVAKAFETVADQMARLLK